MTESSKNPIATVELVGVAAALALWHEDLAGRAVIAFVVNEATKHCMLRAHGANPDMSAVSELAARSEIQQRSLIYWERVPSASNVSDAPSRGLRPPRLQGCPAPVRSWFGLNDVVTCDDAPASFPSSSSLGAAEYWSRHFAWGLRDGPVV